MENPEKLLTDRVFDTLKRDIITHQLFPGQKVSEAKLAKQYGSGKGPIRGALARLISEGLIIRKPRSGHLVAPISLSNIHDTFDLENLLEPAATRQAAGQVNILRLRKINGICKLGFDLSDPESTYNYLLANRNFQIEIAEAAGNKLQTSWISQLQDSIMRIRLIVLHLEPRVEHWGEGHDEIIKALEAGNGAKAEKLTKRNLKEGQQHFFRLLTSNKSKDTLDRLWTGDRT